VPALSIETFPKESSLRLFINLTPFIPLSLKGEGEEILERGEAPLYSTLPLPLLREGGRRVPRKILDFSGCLRGIGC
jgi:hypothetical protein